MWRQGAYWERFARMRDEAPLHWTPDSFVGPFWSVTRYEDIMAVDTDHETFSSDGSIVATDQDEDFALPIVNVARNVSQ